MDKEFYVITFESTHLAISTEREILKTVKVEMVPTPREISASCGLALKVSLEQLELVKTILKDNPKVGMKLYHLMRESGGKVVTPLMWEA